MLKIRQEQLEAMLTQDEGKFIDFIIEHLQRECRDSVRDIDAVSLREMVMNGLVRARSHGLSKAKALTAFVSIMFEIGPNFDEQPEIRRALRDHATRINENFEIIFELVPDSAWEQAERNRNSAAWFPELSEEESDEP
jgi:hypothetical protein